MAEVIADTSVWIRAFRRQTSPEKAEVDRLLVQDAIVTVGLIFAELARGARSPGDLDELERRFTALRWLDTSQETWRRTGTMLRRMREAGLGISLPDALIATCAIDYGCQVYSIDGDFERIPGVSLYVPQTYDQAL